MSLIKGIKSNSEPEPNASQPNSESEKEDPLNIQRAHARDFGVSLLNYSSETVHSKKLEMDVTREHIEGHIKKIESLRQEIEDRKFSLIRRIVDYKEIRALRAELAQKERIVKISEEEQRSRQELIDFFETIIKSETELGELMVQAYKENKEFDERKRQEFIEDEKRRGIEYLAGKHQVFFVHDIVDAEWKPSENNQAIDTKRLNFMDQLNIVLGLKPSLSISTLSPNSKNRTFGNGHWGVLLSGGRIKGGSETDAATVGVSRNSRFIDKELRSVEAIDRAIERPVSGGKMNSESYNELVVERPEVGGVYVKWSDSMPSVEDDKEIFIKNSEKVRYDRWWTSLEEVLQTGVPIFVIEKDNNVRMAYDINLKKRSLKFTSRYNPENLTNMPGIYKGHTTEKERRAAVHAVMDKAGHLLTPEEREEYEKDRVKDYDRKPFYNIY